MELFSLTGDEGSYWPLWIIRLFLLERKNARFSTSFKVWAVTEPSTPVAHDLHRWANWNWPFVRRVTTVCLTVFCCCWVSLLIRGSADSRSSAPEAWDPFGASPLFSRRRLKTLFGKMRLRCVWDSLYDDYCDKTCNVLCLRLRVVHWAKGLWTNFVLVQESIILLSC